MDENDFYEDDEPIEERRAAWKRGERGATSGCDLNARAKAIVDRVAARWDAGKDRPSWWRWLRIPRSRRRPRKTNAPMRFTVTSNTNSVTFTDNRLRPPVRGEDE